MAVARRSRWGWVTGLLISVVVAACGSSGSSSNDADGGGGTSAKKCVVDSDCDDANPCSLDACLAGSCKLTIAPDGDAKTQTQGDCHKTVCKAGVPAELVDNGDVLDDQEPCTLDACENGVPVHTPILENSPCKVGSGNGLCQSGKCWVLCTPTNATTQCNDQNPCTSDACVPCSAPECNGLGQCQHQGLSGMPTPGVSQITGDCREHQCVEGKDTDVADNFDVPNDDNDCTDDVCKNGEPGHPPLTSGSKCTSVSGGICDGQGKCVACLADTDCGSSYGSTCYAAACKNGGCTSSPMPAGTPLPAAQQSTGDCKTLVCDGSGSTTAQADPKDLPNDQNPCTTDECSGTQPTHSKLPAGTSCGANGETCTATGSCCLAQTCAGAGKQCGSMSDGCGTTLDCGTCSSGQTCTSSGQCCVKKQCVPGVSCGSVSDGCGGYLSCGSCATGDTCNSGTCGCADGYKDGNESDVDCGGFCAQKCVQGLHCLAASDCGTGHCADNVCCDSDCSGVCQACTAAKTGLTTGTCGNVIDGTNPDQDCTYSAPATCGQTGYCKAGACELYTSGTSCGSFGSCSAGVEKLADTCSGSGTCVTGASQPCVAPYVCGSTKCQSCSDGALNGNEIDVDCGGGGSCPKCGQGKKCNVAGDCVSGYCVDGVCCDGACGGTCQRCNIASKYGTCSFIQSGQDPDNECPGTKTCNGAGACI